MHALDARLIISFVHLSRLKFSVKLSLDTSDIVAYDPTSDSCQDMGHMTTPRYRTLVALLPSNELIVAGGAGEANLK